jgi:bacillithiol system protein YtxJ
MFLTFSTIKELEEHSTKENILVFKHSNTCPISKGAFERLSQSIQEKTLNMPVYLIVVQENRELSKEIAEYFSIKHDSPQVLLLRNKKCIFNTSHNMVTLENILNQKNLGEEGENICPV